MALRMWQPTLSSDNKVIKSSTYTWKKQAVNVELPDGFKVKNPCSKFGRNVHAADTALWDVSFDWCCNCCFLSFAFFLHMHYGMALSIVVSLSFLLWRCYLCCLLVDFIVAKIYWFVKNVIVAFWCYCLAVIVIVAVIVAVVVPVVDIEVFYF